MVLKHFNENPVSVILKGTIRLTLLKIDGILSAIYLKIPASAYKFTAQSVLSFTANMVIRVVEFSSGDTKFEKFLPKN